MVSHAAKAGMIPTYRVLQQSSRHAARACTDRAMHNVWCFSTRLPPTVFCDASHTTHQLVCRIYHHYHLTLRRPCSSFHFTFCTITAATCAVTTSFFLHQTSICVPVHCARCPQWGSDHCWIRFSTRCDLPSAFWTPPAACVDASGLAPQHRMVCHSTSQRTPTPFPRRALQSIPIFGMIVASPWTVPMSTR